MILSLESDRNVNILLSDFSEQRKPFFHKTENQNIATQGEDLIPQLFLTQGSAFTVKKVSEMITRDDNIMFHWSVWQYGTVETDIPNTLLIPLWKTRSTPC